MNQNLQIQKKQLQLALHYANVIETCERKIAAGNHAGYFKSVKAEAIEDYADALGNIIESSIDIAEKFEKQKEKSFDQRLVDEVFRFTNDEGYTTNNVSA